MKKGSFLRIFVTNRHKSQNCVLGFVVPAMEKRGNVLMHKYEFGRLLGQGNFAKVYHAKDLRTGENVAIKMIDKERILKAGLVDQTKREISVMGLIKHPNVLKIYEVLATKTKIYFIMEYAKGGELFRKLTKGRLHENLARQYFQQLISAIDCCHRNGVYHRDLKPENLLLDENGNLKVADFGLSALVEPHRQGSLLHTTCGTPAYVAPEVISQKGYDGAKADIWSCGVVLYVLLSGRLPFRDVNLIELYRKICSGKYKCPIWFSFEARRLLFRILDPNPETRISISKILESSWFKNGFSSKADRMKTPVTDLEDSIKADRLDLSENESGDTSEANQALVQPTNLNAFDIISLSAGFDLSGLFARNNERKDVKFTSLHSASSIISAIEDMAHVLELKITKIDGGLLKLERSSKGRMVPLSIDAEIFEFTPSFHLIEMKKSSGNTFEYQKMLEEEIKPALRDIVSAWQDEQQQQ